MNTQHYALFLMFFFSSIYGQLSLEFALKDSVATVTVHNKSQNNYIIPLDKFHFRPYEIDCDAFYNHEFEFPSFGLMVNIVTSNDQKEDYVMGYKYYDNFDSFNERVNVERANFHKKIISWGDDNNIKDYNLALINYNLINNLVYLKPNEKKSFKIKFDLYNITAQELIFYSYILEKSKSYKISLSLCNFKEIETYLTPSQKEKLSEYKLFTGKIESNKITLRQ